MKKLQKCNTSAAALVMLLAIAAAPSVRAASVRAATFTANLLAQAPAAFPLPASVPPETIVKIDGSSSLMPLNQALSDRFKAQFSGAQVNLSQSDSEAGLKAVLAGTVDLAAISRPLTAEEQAQGLVPVVVARHKIAIFVGANNPFADSLTGEQVASMLQGEIVNWSQVGGTDAAIRFIDRPDVNDTRRALSRYPIFKTAASQPGVNTVRLETDNTDTIIQQLSNDGISYGIVDQVVNNPAVRVLPLYGTLPTDTLYPFSQALAYVYKGPNPNPAVQAFLGIATAPEAQQTVETARVAVSSGAIAASPNPASPNPASPNPASPNPAANPVPSSSASPVDASPVDDFF
ncbi:MAG: hypothetical protein HC772_00695 [Leptolyngbyaceae cyanobacterium CRU_2_3]|nr:hypothetical protein [Leptolyngbyaceae cyanobacterium CRU_2_3]